MQTDIKDNHWELLISIGVADLKVYHFFKKLNIKRTPNSRIAVKNNESKKVGTQLEI